MDKTGKKKLKGIIALSVAAVLVLALALMPFLFKKEEQADGPQASILSGTVETGSVEKTLIGGGALGEDAAVTVTVPADVKLTGFLVQNGDAVAAGDAVASVDRVTVMTTITAVQAALEDLSDQIEEAGTVTTTEAMTATAGGTVKLLYAQKGDSVQNVMLEHGALAVLSLDGLMAVDVQTESQLPTGTVVTVTFADSRVAEGRIAANLNGNMTVTVEDQAYTVGETVQINSSEGEQLGTGVLYIYSPWNVTAYAGTVSAVHVKQEQQLSVGQKLLTLSDVGYSAAYRQLISKRQAYEDTMLELFRLYQTETLTAPCDGVVTGIDENSLQLLAAADDYSLDLLANAPNGDDETLYLNYAGQIAAVAENGWMLKLNPQAVPVADYALLADIQVDTALMTKTVLYTQPDAPVFQWADGAWVQADREQLGTGDILLFAADEHNALVWCVLLQKAQEDTPDDAQRPSDSGSTQTPTISGSGNMSGFAEEQQLYSLETATVATVTPQNQMTLDITVDELDVTALKVGMAAEIRIDALGGEKHTATVTEIGNIGENNGGHSKFTVTLTMDRTENMLGGMNATASIVLREAPSVLTVPAAALVDQGNETLVYTGYDEKTGTLTNPVVVTVGVSDGETVELTGGLKEGQTYYYAYYDTLNISDTPDFGSSGMFGR